MRWFPAALVLTTAGCGMVGSPSKAPRDPLKNKPKAPSGEKKRAPWNNATPSWQAPTNPCSTPLPEGFFTYAFEWKGEALKVKMYLPGGPPNRDIVVALHGGSGSAKSIVKRTGLDERANDDNFILLVPIASPWTEEHGTRWKTGKFHTKIDTSSFRNDVVFLDALTTAVKGDTCSKDILAVGFSNGGQMVHRWGCQSSIPTAVLSAAGTLLVDPQTCNGPTPVRGYIGTQDRLYNEAPFPDTDQPTAVETFALWSKVNKCSDALPIHTRQGDASCAAWQGCEASTVLCTVDGFPHGWPVPAQKTNPDCDATQAGLSWFNQECK